MECRINDLNTYYIDEGEGDIVFLFHGWGCRGETLRSIIEIVKKKYRVIAVDFPGFGTTDEPKKGWTVNDYSEFTIQFIQKFKCKSTILIGHSFGTRIMINLASRPSLPFEIDKMVFIDAAGILPVQIDEYMEGYFSFQNKKHELLKDGKEREVIELRERSDKDYAYLSESMCDSYYNVVNENLESLLPKISVPTLLIWGERDMDTPLEDGKKMKKLINDSGLVIIKGAGHYSFLDSPYVFEQILKSYLAL